MNNNSKRNTIAHILRDKFDMRKDPFILHPLLEMEERIDNFYDYVYTSENADLLSLCNLIKWWWPVRRSNIKYPHAGWNLSKSKAEELIEVAIDNLNKNEKIINGEILEFNDKFKSRSIFYRMFPKFRFELSRCEMWKGFHALDGDDKTNIIEPCSNLDFLNDKSLRVVYTSCPQFATSVSFFKWILESLPFNFDDYMCSMAMLPNSGRLSKQVVKNWPHLELDEGDKHNYNIVPKLTNYNPLNDYVDIVYQFCQLGAATIYQAKGKIGFCKITDDMKIPDFSPIFNHASIFAYQDFDGLLMIGQNDEFGEWPQIIKKRIS